ncbi:uncharacterized protein G2W53_003844 [Senna tora]|uniref:Uncharacterized protein n=1 Tax=Senna tora TaxID=362788 RepID=A0A835CHD8_9FABA|nr:uncharacterized protein G2W53_003844 [Senna tora]
MKIFKVAQKRCCIAQNHRYSAHSLFGGAAAAVL